MINYKINFHNNNLPIIAIIIILVLLPLISSNNYLQHLIILSMIYGVVASNWDLTFGYFGIFNFGHIGIFIVGAYTAGILSKTFGISPLISIIIASLFSSIVSSIVALPMLRVKGLYVCLVTYAFSQLVYYFLLGQRSLTGGSSGLTSIPHIFIGSTLL